MKHHESSINYGSDTDRIGNIVSALHLLGDFGKDGWVTVIVPPCLFNALPNLAAGRGQYVLQPPSDGPPWIYAARDGLKLSIIAAENPEAKQLVAVGKLNTVTCACYFASHFESREQQLRNVGVWL